MRTTFGVEYSALTRQLSGVVQIPAAVYSKHGDLNPGGFSWMSGSTSSGIEKIMSLFLARARLQGVRMC